MPFSNRSAAVTCSSPRCPRIIWSPNPARRNCVTPKTWIGPSSPCRSARWTACGSIRWPRCRPYQNPSVESGIELIAAVHARQAKARPLPSPLPEPPPVPFAYLMRLNTALAAPELTAAEQAQLFADLNSGLDTDDHEPSARRDLMQLLIRLRDRPDITWKTRTNVPH
jgi:hypothetical protein